MSKQPSTPKTPIFVAEITPSMSKAEIIRRLIEVLQHAGFKSPSAKSVLRWLEVND
jgi:hypothetical protein